MTEVNWHYLLLFNFDPSLILYRSTTLQKPALFLSSVKEALNLVDLLDWADDNMLWNGSEDNGNVESECEEDECTDCEDGDSDNDWW